MSIFNNVNNDSGLNLLEFDRSLRNHSSKSIFIFDLYKASVYNRHLIQLHYSMLTIKLYTYDLPSNICKY